MAQGKKDKRDDSEVIRRASEKSLPPKAEKTQKKITGIDFILWKFRKERIALENRDCTAKKRERKRSRVWCETR